MADLKAKLRLEADGRQASRELKRTGRSFTALAKTAAIAAAAFLAFVAVGKKLVSFLQSTIAEAAATQTAMVALTASFKAAGDEGASEAAKEILDLSKAIEATTNVSKNAVLESAALARSFTTSAAAAVELTQAAVDFAQGAGLSLTEATRRLGRATQGSTEDIAKFVPEIKDLTKAQLEANEATRLIAERFSGQAAEAADTYAARVQNITEAQNNLLDALGSSVVASDAVSQSQENLANVVNDLAAAAERGEGQFGLWNTAMEFLVKTANDAKAAFFSQLQSLGALDITTGKTVVSTKKLAEATKELVEEETRAVRIEKERNDLLAETEGLLAELGLRTQQQLTEALVETQLEQEKLNALYRAGELTLVQFHAANDRLLEQQDGIQAVLQGSAASVEEYQEALEEADRASDEAALASDRYSASILRVGTSASSAAANVSRFNATANQGSGSDSFFQDTRINGQGGGARYGFTSTGTEKTTPFGQRFDRFGRPLN